MRCVIFKLWVLGSELEIHSAVNVFCNELENEFKIINLRMSNLEYDYTFTYKIPLKNLFCTYSPNLFTNSKKSTI